MTIPKLLCAAVMLSLTLAGAPLHNAGATTTSSNSTTEITQTQAQMMLLLIELLQRITELQAQLDAMRANTSSDEDESESDSDEETDISESENDDTHISAQVELTDTSAKSDDTVGEYEITFSITAEDGDAYFSWLTNDWHSYDSWRKGEYINYTKFKNSMFVKFMLSTGESILRYDLGDGTRKIVTDAEREGGYYIIPEGETEEFTLYSTIEPAIAGKYKMQILKPIPVVDENEDSVEVFAEGVFETGYVSLAGTGREQAKHEMSIEAKNITQGGSYEEEYLTVATGEEAKIRWESETYKSCELIKQDVINKVVANGTSGSYGPVSPPAEGLSQPYLLKCQRSDRDSVDYEHVIISNPGDPNAKG